MWLRSIIRGLQRFGVSTVDSIHATRSYIQKIFVNYTVERTEKYSETKNVWATFCTIRRYFYARAGFVRRTYITFGFEYSSRNEIAMARGVFLYDECRCDRSDKEMCRKQALYRASDVVDRNKYRRQECSHTETEEHNHHRLNEPNKGVDRIIYLTTIEC